VNIQFDIDIHALYLLTDIQEAVSKIVCNVSPLVGRLCIEFSFYNSGSAS
jgi:hypothetical protein